MKLFYCAVLALGFFSVSGVWAQSTGISPCATVMPASTRQFIQQWTASASKTTAFADTVALTVHLVGTDNGVGYFPLSSALRLICQTNERFTASGIYFQPQLPVHYIPNSAYYVHDFSGGYNMIMNENVPGTVNVYFVQEAAGACGYFYPGVDGVVIANMCAGNTSTTLAHELGHYMGLPHTFDGWENGQIPPVRERVIRTGPLANCATACDGFCDTDGDFISYRWPCPATAVQYDDLGVRYRPDSSLYMSYSLDACQNRFSGQQMGYMQYVLQNDRPDLLLYTPQPYAALDTPAISYPQDTMWVNDRTIRWAAVPGADAYQVTIRRASGLVMMDTLVFGNSLLTTHPVAAYNRYSATIIPVASSNVCGKKPRVRSYYYSPIANLQLSVGATAGEGNNNLSLFPNPAGGAGWTIAVPHVARGPVRTAVLSLDGRYLQTTESAHGGGAFSHALSVEGLADGVYFIRVKGQGGSWTGRAVLRR